MSTIPLDFAKFRKIKSDDKTSTFQHHEGHTITIAHNKLSSKLKTELSKLPTKTPKAQKFAEGAAPVTSESVTDNPDQIATDAAAQPAQATQQSAPSTAQYDGSLQGPSTVKPPQNSDPYGVMGSFDQQMKGMKEVGAGQQAEQRALGVQGTQNATQETDYQKQSNENLKAYNKANEPILEARTNLMSDIQKGHVDPDRYIKSMTTGDKISTGIGMILGGMGAGLTHGPNLAFQYLQSQIDRDIDAQKSDLGRKQNLLAHNFQQTHDLRSAYDLTKVQSNDMLASHLRMTADKTADPLAKARLMQIAGMTDQNTSQIQHNIAMMKLQQGAFSGESGQNTGMALESMPAEVRDRAVQIPGGGMRLAITKEGAKEIREQIQTTQPIFAQLDRLEALGASATIPGSPAYQEAKAIQSTLIPMINENAGLKRLSGEDIDNIKQMIKDPTKFSGQIAGGARTKAFKQFLQDKMMSSMGSQLEGGMGSGSKHSSGNFGFKPKQK